MIRIALLVLAMSASLMPACAAGADPTALERAAKLAEELRCLVCQNQSIADSSAPLARDLKAQIRDQIALGRSDAEILEYMVARYGDFVLYRPPMKATTFLLWAGPFVVLVAGLGMFGMRLRRASRDRNDPLTADERKRAAGLLGVDSERAES